MGSCDACVCFHREFVITSKKSMVVFTLPIVTISFGNYEDTVYLSIVYTKNKRIRDYGHGFCIECL